MGNLSSSEKSSKLIVTGGAGFIGSNLTLQLMRLGHDVLVVDNFDPYYDPEVKRQNLEWISSTAKSENLSGRFELAELDLINGDNDHAWDKNQQVVRFAKSGIDGIFHLAAKAGVRNSMKAPSDYFLHNLEGTRRVFQAALRSFNSAPIVFASSSSVYGACKKIPFQEQDAQGQTLNPYAASKWICERMIESYCTASGLRSVALRYFTVYGPRQRPEMAISSFIRDISQGNEIEVYGQGKLIRDFTFISDIVEGTINAWDWIRQKPAGTFDCFNLGAQHPVTVSELVEMIETLLGKKAKLNLKPRPAGDMEQTSSDCTRAKLELGFSPLVTLKGGLKIACDWIKGDHFEQ